MKKLISLEDIQLYRPTSVDKLKADVFIEEAQSNDLRPVLGDALFFDLLAKMESPLDPLYTAYIELLGGKSYTYQGINYVYDGIVPMLCYYTIARLRANPMEDTRFGTVSKLNERSAQIAPEILAGSISDLRSMALTYQHRLVEFLQRHATVYTLYGGNRAAEHNSLGTKFFDPDNFSTLNDRSIY